MTSKNLTAEEAYTWLAKNWRLFERFFKTALPLEEDMPFQLFTRDAAKGEDVFNIHMDVLFAFVFNLDGMYVKPDKEIKFRLPGFYEKFNRFPEPLDIKIAQLYVNEFYFKPELSWRVFWKFDKTKKIILLNK